MDDKNVYNYNNAYSQSQEYSQGSMSLRTYNLIIGGLLLYGFLVNVIMIRFFSTAINSFVNDHIILFLVAYFVLAIGGMVMMRSKNTVLDFIGYNLVVLPLGLVLTVVVSTYLSIDSSIVYYALVVTAGATAVMMIAGMIMPSFFLSLGRVLGIGLFVTIILQVVVSLFFHQAATFIDYVVVLLFMAYIGYDWAKAQHSQYNLNNAMQSACSLYVDIVNIFIRLMSIFGRSRD